MLYMQDVKVIKRNRAEKQTTGIKYMRGFDIAFRKTEPTIVKKTFYAAPRVDISNISSSRFWQFFKNYLYYFAGAFVLLLVFFSGMAYYAKTPRIIAEDGEYSQVPAGKIFPLAPAPEGSGLSLNEQALYILPLDKLENLVQEETEKNIKKAEEFQLSRRQNKLADFLKDYSSPFEKYVEVVSKLKHWRLVLAISFAESGLGKRCADFNCGGIGVEPGHALWRTYKNYGEYLQDLDKLLERRYKDWSLQKMCGVYVQPCNENWLRATGQILSEITERKIE